jgi:uncharacterized membrane protein
MKGITWLLLSAVIISLLPQASCEGDGPIEVLYVGCMSRVMPYWLMRLDPLFSFSFVQATLRADKLGAAVLQAGETIDVVPRLIRLNMPRSYPSLASGFDVIVLQNANAHAVGPHYIEMLARGVEEGGLGLLMAGGQESFGGGDMGFAPWGNTRVGKLLPTEDLFTPSNWIMSGSLVIDDEENEFISSLPWPSPDPWTADPQCHDFWHNLVEVRPGAEELAHIEGPSYDDHPGIVTWELEGGSRTLSFTGEIDNANNWEYFFDLGSNILIYVDGRPVPQDLALVHRVRSLVQEVATRRSLVLSLVDFVDEFGANTREVMDEVGLADAVVSEAGPLYLQLSFEESLELYREARDMMERIDEIALRVKNRALAWVHAIEWLSVTGTALASGVVLWTLMVRRGAYRAAGVTRFMY